MYLSLANAEHPHIPGEEQFALAAELVALLGDRTRLALRRRPAVGRHPARLRLGGLVNTRKEGRRVICSLRGGHLRRVVDEALNPADHRLGDRPPHG
ncbi:transcriptional regulator [Streptomyces sp. NPDC050704]|uniref:transcriptional regulator n=1 Tax=Streptomyces sp. NPDC050704 TaxID=3157219 RepID=UPI003417A29B